MAATHQWQAVGEGLHAWIHPIGDWGWSNAGLITGEGGEALLVDTQWDERRTRDMLAIAPVPIGARISTLVLTHGDGDHGWGNRVVGADEIIASTATADHLRAENPAGFGRSAQLLSAIAKAPLPPLPGPAGRLNELRRFARYMTGMTAAWQYGEVRRTDPTRTFDGMLELEIAGRQVQLVDVGSAHSPGDTYVHLPAERVVYAGDLLFVGVAPVMWIGPVRGWIRALDELLALEAQTIVPGHGPVAGPVELGVLRDYWEWAIAVGADGRNAKRSPAETALQAILDTEHEALPWGSWWSPERLVVSLTAMEREAQGRGPIHSVIDRARVMAATAGVAEVLRAEGLATTSFGPPA